MRTPPRPHSALFVPSYILGCLMCAYGCTAVTDFDRMGRDGEVLDAGDLSDVPDRMVDASPVDASLPDMTVVDVPDSSVPDGGTGCAADNGGCAQLCMDIGGEIECDCHSGYTLARGGLACNDIDECATENDCRDAQRCVNAPGTFLCETFVANESFEYSTGSVDGQNGGTGWLGPWQWTYPGMGSTLHVVTPGLDHDAVETVGGQLIHDGSGTTIHQAERRIVPIDTGVTYIRLVGSFAGAGTGGTPTLRFYAGGTLTGGVGSDDGGTNWALLDATLGATAGSTSPRPLAEAEPVLVLIRIDYEENATSLFIEPDLDVFNYASPPTADADMASAPVFDRISVYFQSGSAVDEIQIRNFGGGAPSTQQLVYRGHIGDADTDKLRGEMAFHETTNSAYVTRWEGAVQRYQVRADGGLESPTSTTAGGSQWGAAVFDNDLYITGYYRFAGQGLRRYNINGGDGSLMNDAGYNPLSQGLDPTAPRGLQQVFRLDTQIFVVAGYTDAYRGSYSRIALPDSAIYEVGGGGGDRLGFGEQGSAATCTFDYDPDCYSSVPRIKVVGADAFYSYPQPGATRGAPRPIRVGRWSPSTGDTTLLLSDDGGSKAPIATCGGLLAVVTQQGFALVDIEMVEMTALGSTRAIIHGSRQGLAFSPDCSSLALIGTDALGFANAEIFDVRDSSRPLSVQTLAQTSGFGPTLPLPLLVPAEVSSRADMLYVMQSGGPAPSVVWFVWE